MGIFCDRCERCNARVKKRARMCSQCGAPSAHGWWKCPACSNWVGSDSKFCWNCRAALHPEDRDWIAGGQWQRPPGVVAQRFEVGDLYVLLKRGLSVSEGTVALLLDGGRFSDLLAAGNHTLDSLARRLTHWGASPPRAVVLVDAGDIILPLRVEGLRSAEEIELEFYGEAVLRFDPARAQDFIANLLKDSRDLSFETLSEHLAGEIRYTLENCCNRASVDDLVKDPDRRLRLEDDLRQTLAASLERLGFFLAALSAAEFSGRAYEELRRRAGDLDIRRRQAEFDARLREVVSTDQISALKDEHDLELYARRLAQERDVSDEHMGQEVELLRDEFKRRRQGAEKSFQRTEQVRDVEHRLTLARQDDTYRREKQRLDAQVALETRDAEIRTKLEWRAKAEELERVNDQETRRVAREDEAARAAAYETMSLKALLAVIPDAGRGERLLKLQEQLSLSGRSADEILALQAARSPAVAAAFCRMHEADSMRARDDGADRRRIMDEAADRLERVLREALAALGSAPRPAGVRAGPTKHEPPAGTP